MQFCTIMLDVGHTANLRISPDFEKLSQRAFSTEWHCCLDSRVFLYDTRSLACTKQFYVSE